MRVLGHLLVSFKVVLHAIRNAGLFLVGEQLILHAHALLEAELAELRYRFC